MPANQYTQVDHTAPEACQLAPDTWGSCPMLDPEFDDMDGADMGDTHAPRLPWAWERAPEWTR